MRRVFGLAALLATATAVVAAAAVPSRAAQPQCVDAAVQVATAGDDVLVDLTPLVPCNDPKVYDEFKKLYIEFKTAELMEGQWIVLAMNHIHYAVTKPGLCNDKNNAPSSKQQARVVLTQVLPKAQRHLDKAGDTLRQMRSKAKKWNPNTWWEIDRPLRALSRQVVSLQEVHDGVKSGATMLGALNCDGAMAAEELGRQSYNSASETAKTEQATLEKELQAVAEGACKDFAKQGAPLSPSQVGRAAGGGPGKSTSAGNLEIVAPTQIRASGGVLPLSLRAHENGFVRIELKRGVKMLTGVSGLISTGAASLRIALPTPPTGAAQLRVVFASASHKTSVATLPVRIV